MTIIKSLTISTAITLLLSTSAVHARYEKEECKVPKIRNFEPARHKPGESVPEVEAEGKIGFYVSYVADPTTIRAVAKKKYKLKLSIDDREPFYRVSANLPAELNGKYARIDVRVKAQAGECVAKDGWLVKIKKAAEAPVVESGSEAVAD